MNKKAYLGLIRKILREDPSIKLVRKGADTAKVFAEHAGDVLTKNEFKASARMWDKEIKAQPGYYLNNKEVIKYFKNNGWDINESLPSIISIAKNIKKKHKIAPEPAFLHEYGHHLTKANDLIKKNDKYKFIIPRTPDYKIINEKMANKNAIKLIADYYKNNPEKQKKYINIYKQNVKKGIHSHKIHHFFNWLFEHKLKDSNTELSGLNSHSNKAYKVLNKYLPSRVVGTIENLNTIVKFKFKPKREKLKLVKEFYKERPEFVDNW